MSFETVTQQVVIDRLKTYAVIVTEKIPVSDDVLQPSDSGDAKNFPYIVIGDDAFVEWDTDTELGVEVTVTIHSWSRMPGKKEIKKIQGYIYDALHRYDFSADGYKFIFCAFLSSDSFLDTDGLTRHGVQKFKVLLEKV